MASYAQYFFSHGGQIVSFVSVAILWIGFSALGAALSGPARVRALDPIVGWAWLGFVFTTSGVFFDISFASLSSLAGVLALGAGVWVFRRDGNILPPGTLRLLILMLPLLVLVSAMQASQWDEFSQWLIIPHYMLETGAFPSEDNPYPNAGYTGYPYGWHFVTYLASLIAGELLENAGALSNILLLLIFGLVLVQLIARGIGRSEVALIPGWGLVSLGGAAVFIANPTFAQKIVLTSYAETSSAVATGFAVVLGWLICEALVDKKGEKLNGYAWQMGAVLALLVNLKQATLVLAVLVVLASLLVAIRDRNVLTKEFLRLLPAIILPGLVLYLVWRYHLSDELTVNEISLLPFDNWHFSLIPQILVNMIIVLSKKGYYFALIIIAMALGCRGILRSATPLDRFAIIVSILVIGYNAFLFFAYIATFGEYDAMRVASYWRYNMHLGPAVVAFSVYAAALMWRRKLADRLNWRRVRWLPAMLLLLAPFVFAKKIRFDMAPMTVHFRFVGAALPELLGAKDGFFVCDPSGSGESAQIVQYELVGQRVKYLGRVSAFYPNRLDIMKRAVLNSELNTMIIFSMDTASTKVIGRKFPAGRTYVIQRDGFGPWHEVASWSQPPSQ